MDHNNERFNLIVRDDIDIFSFNKSLIKVAKNAILQVNSVRSTKKTTKDLKWRIRKDEYIKLWYS